MTYVPGVYVVEKKIIIPGERVEPKDTGEVVAERRPTSKHPKLEERIRSRVKRPDKPSQKQPVIVIEEKDRSGREFSTTYDTNGVPIIKLRYSREPMYTSSDGREHRIADLDIINNGSISFISFDRGNFVQGNFDLTKNGFDAAREFLLAYGKAHRRRHGRRRGKTRDLIGTLAGYNYMLKSNERYLIVQTEMDHFQFDALDWVEQRRVGATTSRTKSWKPRDTTQEFNSYIYNALVRTYERFAEPFLGQKK